ncbi:MAG: hypothetical protein LBB59_04585 [Campylobacteraceae bacterium]|jgi:hypothetical protein|nr:hypothetical protein [Campylobacteraceae bacterium]
MKKVNYVILVLAAVFLGGCLSPQPKIEVINDEFSDSKKIKLSDNYVGGGTMMIEQHGLYMDFTKYADKTSIFITVAFHDKVAETKTTVSIYNQRIGGLCTFRADDTNIPVRITKGASDYDVDIVGHPGNRMVTASAVVQGTGIIWGDDLQKFIEAKEPQIKCGEVVYKYNSGENNLYSNPQELNKNFIPLLKQFYEQAINFK